MENYLKIFEKRFSNLADYELIQSFNHEVRQINWGDFRQYYLEALKKEFYKRGFDTSSIIEGSTIILSEKVYLDGKTIRTIVS